MNICGRFSGFRGQFREFRYLQVLTRFEADDFRWSRDPGVPVPERFVDPPPFGLPYPETDAAGRFVAVEHRFEPLPRSEEGHFPLFEDQRRAFLSSARQRGMVRMEFETWLMCVICAWQGDDRERVSDDLYVVAALIRWTRGYAVAWQDAAQPDADEFEDYRFHMPPLSFTTRPSEAFETGLGATFCLTCTDRVHVQLGEARHCPLR